MDFVGRESGGDLGGRANASGIHQNLAPEEADEIGKGKQAGESWGVAAEQQRTREGATKQISWNAESRDANGSESAATGTSGSASRIIRHRSRFHPNGLRFRNLWRLTAAEDVSNYSCVHRCALYIM